jgi:hypothetical protein
VVSVPPLRWDVKMCITQTAGRGSTPAPANVAQSGDKGVIQACPLKLHFCASQVVGEAGYYRTGREEPSPKVLPVHSPAGSRILQVPFRCHRGHLDRPSGPGVIRPSSP